MNNERNYEIKVLQISGDIVLNGFEPTRGVEVCKGISILKNSVKYGRGYF
jgi:hypothetical protein